MSAIHIETDCPSPCPICRGHVPRNNDLRIMIGAICSLARNGAWTDVRQPAQHLKPVVSTEGEMTCPGTPAMAQYLEGYGPRQGHPYDRRYEGPVRSAFRLMQCQPCSAATDLQ